MDHEKAKTLLSDYLDGELDKQVVLDLEEHLSRCSECSSMLASLQQLLGVVRKIPPVRVPENFARKVRRRAYKTGLFGKAGARSTQSMTVPFVGMWATWGMMLVLGLVLIIVFVAQHQMNMFTSQGQFVLTELSPAQLHTLESQARELDFHISPTRIPNRGLIILVPRNRWTQFRRRLKEHGLKELIPAIAPAADKAGIIHLLLLKASDG